MDPRCLEPTPRRWLIGLLLALIVAIAVPATTQAQEDPTAPAPDVAPGNGAWNFVPTSAQGGPGRNWFIFEVQPGQVLRDSVAIQNTSPEPISFAFYPADAYNTENGGQFAIRSSTDPKRGVARWVTLATDAYTVQPGRQVVIPFEVTVPDDAAPGDHVGAIAAMNINPEGQTQSGGVQLDVKRIIGVRIYLDVAGQTSPGLEIDEVRITTDAPAFGIGGDPKGRVSYRVTNTGNTTLSPEVKASVSGGLGGPDEDLGDELLDDLLPGNSVVLTDRWEGLPIAGPVTVSVTARDGDVSAAAEEAAWIVPWPLIVVLILALAALVWLLARRRRRRRADRSAGPSSASKAQEPVGAGSGRS